jgi:metal-responsive CopG/Arc/MetJ family transcriptional regulator
MNVGLRLKDDLVAEIDRVAAANGQTRSRWMANALANAVLAPENDDIPVMPVQGRGNSDDNIRVTVRLDRREIEGIDAVAAPMGMTRNEWIKRTLRWQLWDKAGVLRLAPATQAEIVALRKQVLLIGRNINQAVHAMNAANQPESSLDIARVAGPLIEKCEELKTLLFTTRLGLSASIGAEVGYWTETYRASGA